MSRRTVILGLALLLTLGLVLSWLHVLPGGYRLRSWIQDRAVIQAEDHEAHRQSRLATFRAEPLPPASGCIVFLGSSTIEYWPLATSFPNAPCLNRGIGAESTAEIRSRLAQSLPAVPIHGLVLYAGSRELRTTQDSPRTIADGILALIQDLRSRAASAPIVLLGVLPDRLLTAKDRVRLEELNQLLDQAAAEHSFTFLPTDLPPLRDPKTGRLPVDLSRDNYHLNEAGYAILSAWLQKSDSPALQSLR